MKHLNLAKNEIAENYFKVAFLYCRIKDYKLANKYLALALGIKGNRSIPLLIDLINKKNLN